jgi:hypothetical protein
VRCRGIFPQALAKIGVDAFVLFLQRNGESKDFFLGLAIEVSQGKCLLFARMLFRHERRVPLPTGTAVDRLSAKMLFVLFS